MEKQLIQLMKNVKTYCKRLACSVLAIAFVCATLITAEGEAAKNVQSFKAVALSQCASSAGNYALGDTHREDYSALQNSKAVADALALACSVEPDVVSIEDKDTTTVAAGYVAPSATPRYADPAMSGYEFLGTYLTTGYCACAKCCGKTNGITACGAQARANHTIAADTGVLPFGTQVVLNGQVYTVEDRGGAIRGNRIDIFFASHQEALNYGKRYVDVYRYVGVSENSSTEVTTETPTSEATTTEGTTATSTTEATTATTTAVATTAVATTETPATPVENNNSGLQRFVITVENMIYQAFR